MTVRDVVAVLVTGAVVAGGLAVPGALANSGHHHKRHHTKKHRKHHKAPTPASSPTPAPAQSASADAVAGGTFHLQFQAYRAAGAAATAASGHFTGTLAPGGVALGNFAGPVTCLTVKGNDIGLFYPIKSSSPPGLQRLGAGVFIYMTVDGKGNAVKSSFKLVPKATTDSCDPMPGTETMSDTGSGTATGG